MKIIEFRAAMSDLLMQMEGESNSDEDFWDEACDLFQAVLKARVDAKRASPEYQARLAARRGDQESSAFERGQLGPDQLTTVKTHTAHESIARRDRENAVTGWRLQRWNNDQVGAIQVFVNTGEVQAALPKMYKNTAAERGYRSDQETRQIERERRLAVVQGWSGYIWNNTQMTAIADYVNDGVVSNALPRQYRENDAASRDR